MTKQEKAKDARLQKFFRVSLEEYRAIEAYQSNVLCYGFLLGTTRRGLDHNHTTGQVRGILDWRINRALGIIENAFKESSPVILRQMAGYLESPPAYAIIGERYGIIGKAKNKKKMVYGSVQGPLPVEKRKKKNG